MTMLHGWPCRTAALQEIFAIDPDDAGAEEGTCCGRMQPVLLKGWQRMPW